ncbi:PREDICTED: WD-40 repeat-containing protein MSI4 isoform X2 [Theobroma cacao]|uniref:WD-40 repeat-containing protein MSI4 isoform X2 n=1 Tax=Theobroma cacao TaxID=3641 RepID=A0AB32WJT8_THECC|nr:PREDICTED: WD-40 repeat-containing protein MSI4 isoform X2 [Theobroma cacao]
MQNPRKSAEAGKFIRHKENKGKKKNKEREERETRRRERVGKKMEAEKGRSVEERYTQWKSLVPVLYDWLANHNLVWPSLSCRWGPQLEQATYKNRQRLYLSEQTDGSVPNTLVIANCEVVKPRVAAAEHISQFNEEARSPFVKKYKTIIHPGEVNRIRELPQNSKIVATHTDSPDVLIWDLEAQPNRHAVLGATDSRPDLILTGHQDDAEFALAMCPTEPFVLSGGKDKSVVLWSIHDQISTLAMEPGPTKSPGSTGTSTKHASKGGGNNDKPVDGPVIGPRGIYQGHEDTVEDVQFCPSSTQEFCSVGDDSCLILWDARAGVTPAVKWSPDKSSVFGSSAEDGILNIWDHEKIGKKQDTAGSRAANAPPGLFFQHAGHRDKVVDFHWNASDPWTIVSVSDDCESTNGGGTLQMWRMIDLIYRPAEEVLAELDKFKSHILACEKN